MKSLLLLQTKRALKSIPRLLFGAFLVALVCILLFLGVLKNSQKGSRTSAIATVGIINYDKRADLEFMLPYFEDTTAAASFRFTEMSSEEALKALKSGEICAAMEFPENMLSGIINSTNTHARLYLPSNSTLLSLMLEKYAEAGSHTLGSAQASVYTAIDLYDDYGLSEDGDRLATEINLSNLHYALSRDSLFSERTTSATGALPLTEYYGATAFLCLLLILCAGLGGYLCNASSPEFQTQLKQHGIGGFVREFCLFLPMIVFLLLVSGIGYAISLHFFEKAIVSLSSVSCLVLITFCLAFYSLLFFRLFADAGKGMLIYLFFGIFLQFIGGGFLPYAFLPKIFQDLTRYLPISLCQDTMRHILHGNIAISALQGLLLQTLIPLLLFVLFSVWKSKTANAISN